MEPEASGNRKSALIRWLVGGGSRVERGQIEAVSTD